MKKLQSLSILIIILLGFYGCAVDTVILRNDKGETVKCEASKGPLETCVRRYEAEGYKQVEPEMKMMPMGRMGY